MYENLRNEMKRHGILIRQIADLIQVSTNTAGNKIKGNTDFTVGEAIAIHNVLFYYSDFKWLFKKKSDTSKKMCH